MRCPPERPWIRMLPGTGDGHFHGYCLGCEQGFVVALPAPLGIAIKTIGLYLREHRHCGGAWRKRGSPEKAPGT